ncbi:MAG: fatty acid desaturase [Planctomycetes bacterium]|nr:fatty acid desaturase [Planctomycetota bacterium]
MRESKQLLRATKRFARENRLTSWWHLWSTLFIFSALITIACIPEVFMAVRVAASVLSGLVLVRLFIIYHDYQHGTILKRSPLANAVMTVYGLLTLNPPSIWNRSHNHHHKNNAKIYGADIGSYPVMTVEAYIAASPRDRLMYRVARHPLTIAMGYATIFLYGMCIRSLFVNPRLHIDSAFAIVAHIATIYVALHFGGVDVLILSVIIPSIIAAAIGAYFFYAQHNYPGVKLRSRAEWDYTFAALESSSYLRGSKLMHWFSGNIGYHHVHHLNFHIPFYRLPEAMAAIPELQDPGTTSLRARDVAACLRLKLWDTTKHQLVGFEGIGKHPKPAAKAAATPVPEVFAEAPSPAAPATSIPNAAAPKTSPASVA